MDKDVSKYYIFRNIIFGSFFRSIMFFLWLTVLIVTPIIEPYFASGEDLFSDLTDAYIYTILYAIRFSFLMIAFLSLIFKNRSSNIGVMILILGLSYYVIGYTRFFGAVIVLGMIFIGIGFYLSQKFVIMQNAAPILEFFTKKTVSPRKKPHIFLNLFIEVFLYMIFTFYLRFRIIPDSAKTSAYYAWMFNDLILHAILFILVLFIFSRKADYYQRVKQYFFWLFPMVQISSLYVGFSFYVEEMGLIFSNLPNIINLVIVIIFILWDLINDIEDKLEDPEKAINKDKIYTILLWSYCLTLYSCLNQAWQLEDALIFFGFGFVGLGVIGLINKIAKKRAKEFGISNYNFFNFLFNNLKDKNGNKIGSKRQIREISPVTQERSIQPITLSHPQYSTQSESYTTPKFAHNFCPHCGAKISTEDQAFCQKCGGKLP
ncbi:MAG: zinc ribbon domain-containing protein [Promethearchaeota archaeon]